MSILNIQVNTEGYPHISSFKKLDLPQGFYDFKLVEPEVYKPTEYLIAWEGRFIEGKDFVIEITMKVARERDKALSRVKELEKELKKYVDISQK